MSNKLIFFDFDSTFISVETIDEIATLALAHDQNKEQKIKEITDITNEAMTGKFDFSVALQKRLELLSPTKEHIKEVTQKIMNLVSPSFTRNQEKLKSAIRKYLKNPELALQYGSNARKEICKFFTVEIINNQILKIYEDFLNIKV